MDTRTGWIDANDWTTKGMDEKADWAERAQARFLTSSLSRPMIPDLLPITSLSGVTKGSFIGRCTGIPMWDRGRPRTSFFGNLFLFRGSFLFWTQQIIIPLGRTDLVKLSPDLFFFFFFFFSLFSLSRLLLFLFQPPFLPILQSSFDAGWVSPYIYLPTYPAQKDSSGLGIRQTKASNTTTTY